QTTTVQNVTTVAVTVEVLTSDTRLKTGMNATCNFITARHKDVLVVPNAAVKRAQNGATVTAIEGGKPVERPVQLGLVDSSHTEILSGVQEGEEIVATRQGAPGKATPSTGAGSMRRSGGPPPF
ncbi:MAG TPA: macrolide transporter, partial [Armatimonadota bacterium]